MIGGLPYFVANLLNCLEYHKVMSKILDRIIPLLTGEPIVGDKAIRVTCMDEIPMRKNPRGDIK